MRFTVEQLAHALRTGKPTSAQRWELDAAAQLLATAAGDPSGLTVAEAQASVAALNKLGGYRQTDIVARAWARRRGFDSKVTKHHAQALINLACNITGLDAAEALLSSHLKQAGAEGSEYRGLLGRVAKQRFVMTGRPEELITASDRYLTEYQEAGQPYWHGINAVALLAREQSLGMSRPGLVTAEELASQVLAQVKPLYSSVPNDPWVPATVAEAALALGDCDTAEFWAYRFAEHPQVNPFALESFERQIREIWGGSAVRAEGCADRLAALLARQLVRVCGALSFSLYDVSQTQERLRADGAVFEKNFTGQFGFSLANVRDMLERSSCIGCVCNAAGQRLGTGFLVSGDSLGYAEGSAAPLFVTNAHVLSDKEPGAIGAQNAFVTFEAHSPSGKPPTYYPVDKILFSSPPGALGESDPNRLDATVARLKEVPQAACLPVARSLPVIDAKSRAYVVGHPGGGGLQISLHDSRLLDVDDHQRLIHYRTPTDPGSSGSPVFNMAWELIGLHHAGSPETPYFRGTGTYEANEAITISAIASAIRDFKAKGTRNGKE